MVHAAGAETLGDENMDHKRNQYTMTCSGIKMEVSSEDEVVLGGFNDDVCGLCGRHFAFLDQLNDRFNKHTDEVCCHLCPTKFSHINSLALHIKSVHPSLCKSCILGQHLSMQRTLKTEETMEEKPLLVKVEEVLIENEEVEIKYVKEEEEEMVERFVTNQENGLTEPPKGDKNIRRNAQDHNYFSTQACSSIRDTTKDVVMYTSNENVLVVINKADTSISPKDQQGAPVGDQTGIRDDHASIYSRSHAKHILPVEQEPAHNIGSNFSRTTVNNVMDRSTENQHVFNDKLDTRVSSKDPESHQNQTQWHELVHLLDHDYVSKPSLKNHPFLPKLEPSKEDTWKNYSNDVPLAGKSTQHSSAGLVQSSGGNIKLKEYRQPISKEVLIEERVENSPKNDLKDGHTLSINDLICTFQDDLCSNTISTGTNRYISNKDCNSSSWSAGQKQACKNANQKPLGDVCAENSNAAASLPQMCTDCGCSKRYTGKDSMERCKCKEFSTCSLCGMVFGTEKMLLIHHADKHPSVRYICSRCKQLFPNQNIFLQHVCSKFTRFSQESFKDPGSFESHWGQTQWHELVHSNLLDHNYVSTQSLKNHPGLLKQVLSKDDTRKNHSNVSLIEENTCHSSTPLLQSSQGGNMMVKDNFQLIPEDAVIEEHVEIIQRRYHKDSYILSINDLICTFQDDLCSNTISTGTNGYISNVDCDRKSLCLPNTHSKSACQIQTSGNAELKPLGPVVESVNSNPAASLYKVPKMCTDCGRSKLYTGKDSMERCTCKDLSTCSVCGLVFGTEKMLLIHQADKHPSAKYICARCKQLFPNQSIFLKHVCSKSTRSGSEPFTLSNGSILSKESTLAILKLVALPAAENLNQPISSQSVRVVNTAQKLGTVLNSTLHPLPNSLSTSASRKSPVHVMTTRSSSGQKKVTCCTTNGGQKDKVTASVSTVTEKPKTLQAVTQTTTNSFSSPSSSSSSSSSSQNQGQLTPIPTLSMSCQTKNAKLEDFLQLTEHQQQPSSEVHLLQTIPSQVSSSISIPSQTDQQPGRCVPSLDIGSFSLPTQSLPVSKEPLKIVAMFVNQSRELALQKRMRQNWRSKAVFPCRRCGAVSRQFSLSVRHRYQHRGPRPYKCQCGRTFHQRMHLLRHQVQHAEATRYVCAACGQMFCGTRRLACHRTLFWVTHLNRKTQVTKECRNVFQCHCGYSFTRPAALLWHMLKNAKAHCP